MSGCSVTTGSAEHCLSVKVQNTAEGITRMVCNDRYHRCFGLALVKRFRDTSLWCPNNDANPWIFDIARRGKQTFSGLYKPLESAVLVLLTLVQCWMHQTPLTAGYVTMFGEEFCADGSPYVAQGNLFELTVDYLPHEYFCRQAESELSQKGVKDHAALWRLETDPNPFVALDYIEAIYDSYDDIPKLIYLNALAAHVYNR
jgi:hypothetical protein